jgi:hypothetical protein
MMRCTCLLLLLPLALAASSQDGRKHLKQQFVRSELASVFGSPFAEQLQHESESLVKVCLVVSQLKRIIVHELVFKVAI